MFDGDTGRNESRKRDSGHGTIRRDYRRDSSPFTKLIVNNLDYAVTDEDIEELFNEFGPLRRVNILYNRSGRSSGAATLVFEKAEDAREAKLQYNGVPLDGRPMEITLVSNNSRRDRSFSPRRRSRSLYRSSDQ